MSKFTIAMLAGATSMMLASCANADVPSSHPTAASCKIASGPQRGALLELYTSEGCSSCPPADRWFGQQSAGIDPQKLSLLAFHVDYWDSLGWHDRFDSSANTERQSTRVAQAGSRSVYTPQVMLGTHTGVVWHQDAQVTNTIRQINAQASPLALGLDAHRDANNWQVDLTSLPQAGKSLPPAQVWLALYENGLSSNVRAGENSGVTLHHDRVVRALYGPWPLATTAWTKSVDVKPPTGSVAAQLGLTAFVQTKSDGDTLQALSLPLASCR